MGPPGTQGPTGPAGDPGERVSQWWLLEKMGRNNVPDCMLRHITAVIYETNISNIEADITHGFLLWLGKWIMEACWMYPFHNFQSIMYFSNLPPRNLDWLFSSSILLS